MSSWAKPGVKCVCIASPERVEAGRRKRPWGNFPSSGGIYTIRGSVFGSNGQHFILLEEVQNPPRLSTVGVVEWGFPVSGFRPLITRTQQQDVELFRSLLTDLPVGEDA